MIDKNFKAKYGQSLVDTEIQTIISIPSITHVSRDVVYII